MLGSEQAAGESGKIFARWGLPPGNGGAQQLSGLLLKRSMMGRGTLFEACMQGLIDISDQHTCHQNPS
ncbi:MAG TPA: hypothetical protein VMA37_14210 [Acetobacteraceae bacterium]|nr:hypothetical protein [Acetobacteraceae bacterium]